MPKNESEVVKMAAKDKLTEQQEKFCLYFRKTGGNKTLAAIKAGYSKKTAAAQGSRLLKNVNVNNRIKELADDAARKTIMDTVERQEQLTKIARDPTAENRDRVRAMDILNKMDGKYLIKVDVTVTAKIGEVIRKRKAGVVNG